MIQEISIFIPSCDKYSDVWNPFFTLFFKYWKDCPFKIYLCANKISYPDQRVKSILVGDDIAWSTNCKKALEQIKEPYIILLQEDFLIFKPVNTKKIIELAFYMKKKQAACLRLYPSPPPDIKTADNPEVGEILKGAAYRVSLQAAIWEKHTFIHLLNDNETPWDMEAKGSKRSNDIDIPFLSVKRSSTVNLPIDYFSTGVVGGTWVRRAIKMLRKENLTVDKETRPIETIFRQIKRERVMPLKGKIGRIIRNLKKCKC